MSEWREYTLGELTDNYDSARRPIKSSERTPGPTPYYGASGVVDSVEGFTHEGEYLLVGEDGENLRSRSTPIAFLARGKIWVNNHAHVVRGKLEHDTRFLEYALACTDISGFLTGSAQPKLSKTALEAIRLWLPAAGERKAIAQLLGALDDKIAINDQVVAASERLMVATVTTVKDRVQVSMLAQQSMRMSNPGLIDDLVAHFSLPAFDMACTPEVTPGTSIKSNKFIIDQECVLVSKLNPRIPRVWAVEAKPERQAFASTEFVVLVSKGEVTPSLLWSTLSGSDVMSELASKVAGTSGSHQRVKPADVLGMFVTDVRQLPAGGKDAINSLGYLCHALRKESARLAETRDQLLPLLMSGKVRVREAEKLVEEVV
jgi:type I restriction enzyme S subunit